MYGAQKLGNGLVAAGGVIGCLFLLGIIMQPYEAFAGIRSEWVFGSGFLMGLTVMGFGIGTVLLSGRRHKPKAKPHVQLRRIEPDMTNRFRVKPTEAKDAAVYQYDLKRDRYREDSRLVQAREGKEHVLNLRSCKVVYMADDQQQPVYTPPPKPKRRKVVYDHEDDKHSVYKEDHSYWYNAVYEDLFK